MAVMTRRRGKTGNALVSIKWLPIYASCALLSHIRVRVCDISVSTFAVKQERLVKSLSTLWVG